MPAYCISVNRDHFLVNSDDKLRGWKAGVLDAVRKGGDFVEMVSTAGVVTALLVTSDTKIAVREVVPATHHEPVESADLSRFDDL